MNEIEILQRRILFHRQAFRMVLCNLFKFYPALLVLVMRRELKKGLVWAHCHRYLLSKFVQACFRIFRLKGI